MDYFQYSKLIYSPCWFSSVVHFSPEATKGKKKHLKFIRLNFWRKIFFSQHIKMTDQKIFVCKWIFFDFSTTAFTSSINIAMSMVVFLEHINVKKGKCLPASQNNSKEFTSNKDLISLIKFQNGILFDGIMLLKSNNSHISSQLIGSLIDNILVNFIDNRFNPNSILPHR